MSPRARQIAFAALALVLAAVMAVVYQRYVWNSPDATLSFARGATTYVLRSPRLLGVLLVTPLFLLILPRSLADLPWQQQLLSLGLRLALVTALALALARVARTERAERVYTIFLVDVSDSVSPESLADARASLKQFLDVRRPDDRVRVVTFARRPRLLEMDETAKEPPVLARHDVDKATHFGAGTNLQAALQLAYGLFPPGYLRHAVLFSDGVETDGDVLAEANRAEKLGVKLFTVPYRGAVPGEVAIQRLPIHRLVVELPGMRVSLIVA